MHDCCRSKSVLSRRTPFGRASWIQVTSQTTRMERPPRTLDRQLVHFRSSVEVPVFDTNDRFEESARAVPNDYDGGQNHCLVT